MRLISPLSVGFCMLFVLIQIVYHPSEAYQGDVVFLTCEEKEYDPRLFWQPYLANPLEIQTVSGNHFSMLIKPHVSALAAQLQRYLDQ